MVVDYRGIGRSYARNTFQTVHNCYTDLPIKFFFFLHVQPNREVTGIDTGLWERSTPVPLFFFEFLIQQFIK
jgi:hypothetical protein